MVLIPRTHLNGMQEYTDRVQRGRHPRPQPGSTGLIVLAIMTRLETPSEHTEVELAMAMDLEGQTGIEAVCQTPAPSYTEYADRLDLAI